MKKNFRKIFVIFFALMAMVDAEAKDMSAENKLRYASTIIERFYVDTIDMDHVAEEAIIAMLKTLDPHSIYSNKEETRELTEPLNGNFSGIGIQFAMVGDTLRVIQTIASGPSEKVGILPGDRILLANDSVISGAKRKNADIMKILRGPKGTKCRVKVLRQGVADTLYFNITRDDIPIYSVDASYMAAPHVGYIRVSRFAENTPSEVKEAIKQLAKNGMQDLIIDLQDNGGGFLNAATEFAEMLLDKDDPIVYTKGLNTPGSKIYAQSGHNLVKGKVVVLVNQYSASASEILSGAVQDNDRGVIVGRRTFGKGLVQRPFPFPDGSMIRLTVARYYTPSNRCIQKPYEDGDDDTYRKDMEQRYKHGEFYNADSAKVAETDVYYTLKKQRKVYGGGGIMPDKFVAIDTTYYTPYYRNVLAKGVFNNYSSKFVDSNRTRIKKEYKNEDAFVTRFEVTDQMLRDFVDMATAEGVKENEEEFNRSRPYIATIIKALIGRDLYNQSTYYRIANSLSNEYSEALRIITNAEVYDSFLK